MRFGTTLEQSIYVPWRDHYIDYNKLKTLLREDVDPDSAAAQRPWTEDDEFSFVHELINVQLEKVHNFQREKYGELQDRTAKCEERLNLLLQEAQPEGDETDLLLAKEEDPKVKRQREEAMNECLKELDGITKDVEELERYARVNFTGFLKAAKKHDRRERGLTKPGGKGKAKERQDPKVRPILQVRLAQLEFNKENYSPLLYRLSTMYDFIRQNLSNDKSQQEPTETAVKDASKSASQPSAKTYTSHKFWVHPDNILEVKTFILRRLPVLVYNSQPSKSIDHTGYDPTITSLYFDNPKFALYNNKVVKKKDASSVRVRWYGDLDKNQEVFLERKTIRGADDDTAGALEERIAIKTKYINDFINGTYSMEKQVQKRKDRNPDDPESAEKYASLVSSLQEFIREQDLAPTVRASYKRTAFQIPGDETVRISLDTDMALIREDALDSQRPCRDPEEWHRRDIDDAHMEYPFTALRKGEISRFPYALLEIKLRGSDVRTRTKSWIHELMTSHLVHPSPRFSKFVHGVAVLFDDYVNTFPFWLGELEQDIRKDPRAAYDAEQERIKKQKQDEMAVGSFRPGSGGFGGRSPKNAADVSSSFPRLTPQGPSTSETRILPRESDPKPPTNSNETNNSADPESILDDANTKNPLDNPLDAFRQLFPSFTRYGRAHRRGSIPKLPPGVVKPSKLLMHEGPVKVEAKVWLANQRTFIKWMHITVLLATMAIALFNSTHAKLGAAMYTAVAVFAGAWGWGVFMWRSRMIERRDKGEFDAVVGPLVVCVALAIGLVVQFVVRWQEVTAGQGKHHGHGRNGTVGMGLEVPDMVVVAGSEL